MKSDTELDSNTPMINCFALDSGQASDSIRPTSKTDSSADSHLENRGRRVQRSGRSRVSLPADTDSSSNSASQLSTPSHHPSSISTPASINESLSPIDGDLTSFGEYSFNPFFQPNYNNSALTDPFLIQQDMPPLIQQGNGLGTIGDYNINGWPTTSQPELDIVFRDTLSELGEDLTWMYESKRDPSPKDAYNYGRHYPALHPSHDFNTPLVLDVNNFNSAGTSSLPYHSGLNRFPYYTQSPDPYQPNLLYDPYRYTSSNPNELQNMQQFYHDDPQLSLGLPQGYPQDYYPGDPSHGPADNQQADLDQLLYLAEQQYSAEMFKFNEN